MPPKSTTKGQSSLIGWVKARPRAERPTQDSDAESDADADNSKLLKQPVASSSKAATTGELEEVTEPKQRKKRAPDTLDDEENPPAPTKKKAAPKPRAALSKPGAGKKKRKKPVISEDEEEEEDGSGLNRNKTHADDMKHAPLSTMPEIFRDIVRRNPELKSVAEAFKGRKFRVATMCSGTESPLLALQLICEAMNDTLDADLEVEHVFSCEIEPFKQAYIERNFHPPILFRDVTELGGERAWTAYGSVAEIPGNVDMLIAGTSCVDYSTLNNQKKGMDAGGESGNTFYGMRSWVANHRPPFVILENVCGAPWKGVVEKFKEIGYSAGWARMDTKNFYIPHTRTRVYLLAVDDRRSTIPEQWLDSMKTDMPRPASSTFDSWLLHHDDPRIHASRQRLVMESQASADRRRKEVDWARCEQRHARARHEEELGNKRPLIAWVESGGAAPQDHVWGDWVSGGVPRVKDLLDISHLRGAKGGIDTSYKTTIWNLSQNVDRQIGSGRLGIAPCLTPTMIPYITNRGGPLVGYESLALQGLPVDRLLLTRETQDQLADLAGNAMSTTVVGSCIIRALTLGIGLINKQSIKLKEVLGNENMDVDNFSETARPAYVEDLDARISGRSALVVHPLDFSPQGNLSLEQLLTEAKATRRLCACEGRDSVTDRPIRECADCGSTSCIKCGVRPEHSYVEMKPGGTRPHPRDFGEKAKNALPMVLRFDPQTIDFLEVHRTQANGTVVDEDWKSWRDTVIAATESELHFVELKRQDIWVAVWESPSARLEFHLHPKLPEWRLFAVPNPLLPANSSVRSLLSRPVARLFCKDHILGGQWQYAIPAKSIVNLVIAGTRPESGDDDGLVDSWEKSLGLTTKELKDKRVWKQLSITLEDPTCANRFDRDVQGTYLYLPKCGAASASLHKQVKDIHGNLQGSENPDLFFFLDPTRSRDPSWDPFVFSTNKRRLEFKEYRPVVASLDPNWRQSDAANNKVKCHITFEWVTTPELVCRCPPAKDASYAVPSGVLGVAFDNGACAKATALLACRVPLGVNPDPLWPRDKWFEVDELREREIVRLATWVLQRIRTVPHIADWIPADLPHDGSRCGCERCAPTPPEIRWFKKLKGNSFEVKAIEDPQQAAPYERALKTRPNPFQIHVKNSTATQFGEVVIGVNPTTLVHRAASLLPDGGLNRKGTINADWRLDTNYVPAAVLSKPNFVLLSNRNDRPARQPEHFKILLRPEQLRSLAWMVAQESPKVEPFMEVEICEGVSEHLGWRIEGRARRDVIVRGGVLADQVGYGKTAIMLGLIDSRPGKVAKREDQVPGTIPVKATLVVVPAHLCLQWADEVKKFFKPKSVKVEVLHQGSSINKLTVEDVQDADIIIVASTIFNQPHYGENLSSFSGVFIPDKATRYQRERLKLAKEALAQQVERLQKEGAKSVLAHIEKAHKNADEQEQFIQPTRLKGSAYAKANEGKAKALQAAIEQKQESVAKTRPIASSEAPVKTDSPPSEPHPKPKKMVFDCVEVPRLSELTRKMAKTKVVSEAGTDTEASSVASSGGSSERLVWRRKSTAAPTYIFDTDEEEEDDQPIRRRSHKSDTADEDDFELLSGEEAASDFELEGDVEDDEEDDEEVDTILTEEDEEEPKKGKAKATAPKPVKKPGAKPKASKKRKTMSENEGGKGVEEPAKKKQKVEKPKKSRAIMDPWKLGTKDVQGDWTQMHAPPLHMFHFHRIVIDEFTYTKKEQVAHAYVTQLAATCRWVMSGTPPTGDFAAVKGIATFLNIHLGVDDDAEGTTEEVKAKIKDKTAAEAFHSFREVRSAHWHRARQEIAQGFLDRFVRQNIAEIDEIPMVEHIHAVEFSASERAIYLELDHHLRLQELKMKKTGGKAKNDRTRRLDNALGESKTPEEALLKAASHFDCKANDAQNSLKACDIIFSYRQAEFEECKNELLFKLDKAFTLERSIKDRDENSHFRQALNEFKQGSQVDTDTTAVLTSLVHDAKDPNLVAERLATAPSKKSTLLNARGGRKGKGKDKPKGKGKKNPEPEEDEMEARSDEDESSEPEGEKVPQTEEDRKWALRELSHELRALAKELGGRIRSMRFFEFVREFQREDIVITRDCPACGRKDVPLNELSILSSCGHVGCTPCVRAQAANELCIKHPRDCKIGANPLFVVPAGLLGKDRSADGQGRHWGQKLEDIIALIQSIPPHERILVFVQFPDLTKKVAEALEARKIVFSEIRGTAIHQSKVLQDFQSPNSKSRVLLLNLGDESASGGNLTVANHTIFISPLLARTQHEYNQAETQAIGRIRRYGQTKTANLYRFVTCSTIDEEIYKSRGQNLGDLSHRVQKFGKVAKGNNAGLSGNDAGPSGVKVADADVMEID